MKKAYEGHKSQAKARGWDFLESYNFFVPWASFGVNHCRFSLFFTFKAEKVKKATLVARNTKLQMGTFVDSSILLQCS